MRLINIHGNDCWSLISKEMKNKFGNEMTRSRCSMRWDNHLNINTNKGPFTEDEELIIFDAHSKFGNKWLSIAELVNGRTPTQIKNFWSITMKKCIQKLIKSIKELNIVLSPEAVIKTQKYMDEIYEQAAKLIAQVASDFGAMEVVQQISDDVASIILSDKFDIIKMTLNWKKPEAELFQRSHSQICDALRILNSSSTSRSQMKILHEVVGEKKLAEEEGDQKQVKSTKKPRLFSSKNKNDMELIPIKTASPIAINNNEDTSDNQVTFDSALTEVVVKEESGIINNSNDHFCGPPKMIYQSPPPPFQQYQQSQQQWIPNIRHPPWMMQQSQIYHQNGYLFLYHYPPIGMSPSPLPGFYPFTTIPIPQFQQLHREMIPLTLPQIQFNSQYYDPNMAHLQSSSSLPLQLQYQSTKIEQHRQTENHKLGIHSR